MNRFKKYILGATIFILTVCSTSFASNQVSWNDFSNWVNENLEIDISDYANCGMSNNDWGSFKSFFNASNGFYIYEDDDGMAKLTTYDGTIFFVFCKDQMPTQNIRVENQSYTFYSSDIPTNTEIYIFNKQTKNFVGKSSFTSKNYSWFKWNMSENDSVTNFYSEENSKYVLHNQVLCASNYSFLVQNLQATFEWAYSLTVTEMLKTPFPWSGTGSGDSIIYDFKFENFKQKYFVPFIQFNAPLNGYVDYTGNWDKGTTWEINDTTYRDNDFYLFFYSGDGAVDSNIYNGYLYLDVFKANYITSGDINYTYYDSKKCSPEQVFINREEISENIMKYRFTLKRSFNNEEDYNTGWLNDLSTNSDYIFRLRFENASFETTSKTSWFYFNLQSPLSLYRNTSAYNIPEEYINADENFENYFLESLGLNAFGGGSFGGNGGGGGGFRGGTESGTNVEDIIESSKAFLSNFLGFFDIFPPWFNTLIALALSVAIICRIIGR